MAVQTRLLPKVLYCDPYISYHGFKGVYTSLQVYTLEIQPVNPLTTNDAPMRHGLSISHKNLHGGLILGVILQYMVSASFSCFLWSVKG